jgi:hypothetical protein
MRRQTRSIAYIVVVLGDVVASNEKCKSSTCEYDASILREVVANLENDQRDNNDHDNSPEAEKLGGQQVCILVGQHDEVVAFDIQKGQDEESPTIFYNHLTPFGEAVLVNGEGGVYNVQQNIVEEGLESRNTRASIIDQRCEGVRSSLRQSNDLGE